MQEPKRTNLLDVVLKSLAFANRRTFIHRIIYIINHKASAQTSDLWLKTLETNLRKLNDERWEDPLAGLALLYPGYVINILEGIEDTLNKHMSSLMKFIGENKKLNSKSEVKILVMIPHIIKRYFVSWRGVSVRPPVLMEVITDPHQHATKARECILKLYKLAAYLNQQTEGTNRGVLANLSKNCKQFLPEIALIEFLVNSPLLMTGEEYVMTHTSAPSCQFYHEMVWPSPPDFVPHNILISKAEGGRDQKSKD